MQEDYSGFEFSYGLRICTDIWMDFYEVGIYLYIRNPFVIRSQFMLEIKKYGEAILRKKTKMVENVDDEIRKLISFMVAAMYENNGVGLAANQIGLDLNMAVMDSGNGLKILINPKITKIDGEQIDEEGCLSFPGVYFKIKRPKYVEVEALDRFGKSQIIKAQALEARAICHEVDHLNGKLIIDRIGWWQRWRWRMKI